MHQALYMYAIVCMIPYVVICLAINNFKFVKPNPDTALHKYFLSHCNSSIQVLEFMNHNKSKNQLNNTINVE